MLKYNQNIQGKAQALREEGYSYSVIQQKIQFNGENIPISSLWYLCNPQRSSSHDPEGIKRGRRNMITQEQKDTIISKMEEDRELSAAKIQKDKIVNFQGISTRSIQRIAKEEGLQSRQKRRKAFLREIDKKERLNFAINSLKLGNERIMNFCFDDESYLSSQRQGRNFIRKYDDEEWNDERFLDQQKKYDPLSVFAWGIISKQFRVLHWVDKDKQGLRLNGDKYREILKTYVTNDDRFKHSREGLHFVMDKSACHTSKETKSLLKSQNISFSYLPTSSPDLNPIENFWARLQDKAWEKRSLIKTRNDLWQTLQKYFYSNEFSQIIESLYQSYSDRLQEVKALKGKHTKY